VTQLRTDNVTGIIPNETTIHSLRSHRSALVQINPFASSFLTCIKDRRVAVAVSIDVLGSIVQNMIFSNLALNQLDFTKRDNAEIGLTPS
jgi:uncharacterized protein YejL (UPF0352 family)